jgi:hypothetical protein
LPSVKKPEQVQGDGSARAREDTILHNEFIRRFSAQLLPALVGATDLKDVIANLKISAG